MANIDRYVKKKPRISEALESYFETELLSNDAHV